MSPIRRLHPVAFYFALAWLISWAAWLPLVLQAHVATGWHIPPQFHYLGSWGPLIAALIVTAEARGARGLRVLFADWFARGPGAHWLAIGLLSPFALFALAAVIARLGGAPWPDLAGLAGSDEFPSFGFLGFLAINVLTFGLGEEAGWRGFALPRLLAEHRPARATLIVAAGWVVWHLPSFFYRPGLAGLGAMGTFGWAIGLVLGAYVASWLWIRGGWGIVPVVLWHGALDTVYTSRAMRPDLAALFTAGFMVWGAIAMWRLARPHGTTPRSDEILAASAARRV